MRKASSNVVRSLPSVGERFGTWKAARVVPRIVAFGLIAAAVIWVLFAARPCSDAGCTTFQTTFGSAIHDPSDFVITLMNGVTAAGLYFIVASGFTLIFGLMRVVNMDIALRVAEQVTMMHEGEVMIEGTPAEIRSNELVHDLYLGRHYAADE